MNASALSTLSATRQWIWRGFSICYQAQGDVGPAVVLVHGFGASWGHWRKNIPALATQCRVYAIDLIGFGGSAKPAPGATISYTFETWGDQIADFCREVVGEPAYLVGNSIGCIAAMQAAIAHPAIARKVAILNCSIRLLHERRQQQISWFRSTSARLVQKLFGIRWFGALFYRQVAQPQTVRRVLKQAYKRHEAVTEELVEMLMQPAKDPGAVDVFLAFTRYSQGPLPEDQLAVLPCPAIILWGTEDPWEPFAMGKELAKFPCVEEFVPLEGLGHCPQDEAPEVVNPLLLDWIAASANNP